MSASGSTNDARLLKESSIYEDIIAGSAIPTKSLALGKLGKIPLVTIADSAFPSFSWLVKCYGDNARENQQRYVNAKLCSARVVTENCYGMLKGRFRLLLKPVESRERKLKYAIMACIVLHNLCIKMNDPCEV